MIKKWTVQKLDKAKTQEIARQTGLPAFLCALLNVRGINTVEEAAQFLSDTPAVSPPDGIKDMDKAVSRIERAIDGFESICVYGDYDADGVTSTALLYSYLETRGADVRFYIPSREDEGYGMNNAAIDKLHSMGVGLIITVDNGISAYEQIEYANSLGIDTVVTDHHMPPEKLPPACAVVDLHRKDCPSRFKLLSGVGVAFKLVMALEGTDGDIDYLLENYADIVAIGTVGDIVALRDENRAFVKYGLRNMAASERRGLLALIENANLTDKEITSGRLSFGIVPRINAGGRLALSNASVELLLTEDPEYAEEIAEQLGEDNAKRQEIEKNIIEDIEKACLETPELLLDRVIVIAKEGWHQGVIGIAAARVKECTGKPCIVICCDGETAKGSGRSIEGFSLCDAVAACSDKLIKFGGHPMAAGIALKAEDIDGFRTAINEYAKGCGEAFPEVKIDFKLNPAQLSLDIARQIKYLEPFGAGNPSPLIGLFNLTLVSITELGGGKHLKLGFERNGVKVNAMLFFTTKKELPYCKGDTVDLGVSLDINEYMGGKSLSVIIREHRFSNVDYDEMLRQKSAFDGFLRGERITPEQKLGLIPSRQDFARIYRYLKAQGGFYFNEEVLAFRLDMTDSYGKLLACLHSMQDLSLIKLTHGLSHTEIEVLPFEGKTSIENAKTIILLNGADTL